MPKPSTVTAAEFVQNVADRLKNRRVFLGWSVTDVWRHGGPTGKTVQKVEAGHLAAPDVMEKHITALSLTFRDVYLAALTLPHGQEVERFSHAASEVARIFDQATPIGQKALQHVAGLLDAPERRRRLAKQLAPRTKRLPLTGGHPVDPALTTETA